MKRRRGAANSVTIDQPGQDLVQDLLRQKPRLMRFLERRMASRSDAEDLLQTAFLRVVAQVRPLRRPDRVVPWFYRILRNLIVDWHRRQAAAAAARARIAANSVAASRMEIEPFREGCGCVWDVLAALRPEYAEVIRRVELDEQSPREVAHELGLTPGNVSVRLHRARRALRDGLRLACGTCFQHGCLDCVCKRRRVIGQAGGKGR